jgi:pimeloyl-ACP methyl ester carboxylesterase
MLVKIPCKDTTTIVAVLAKHISKLPKELRRSLTWDQGKEMHGFPDNAWSYRVQLQAFADAGYRAVAPFLRGYAPTGIPADGIFDSIALGKDLEALIAALSDDGQACVVGMDWGGTSTFQALATAPSAIKAAVVMNTAHPITISSNRKDPEVVRSLFHVYFFPDAWR